jgi:hypothetical protein
MAWLPSMRCVWVDLRTGDAEGCEKGTPPSHPECIEWGSLRGGMAERETPWLPLRGARGSAARFSGMALTDPRAGWEGDFVATPTGGPRKRCPFFSRGLCARRRMDGILRLPELRLEGRERRSRRSAREAWEYAMNFDLGMESVAPTPGSRSLRTQDGNPASPRVGV